MVKKIFVKVKTGAREEKVEETGENEYTVSVREAPEKGRANLAVEALLAKHFGLPRSAVSISAGHTSRYKIINIQFPISNDKSNKTMQKLRQGVYCRTRRFRVL